MAIGNASLENQKNADGGGQSKPGGGVGEIPFTANRINLRTLILIRWTAIAGQLATILIVHFAIGYAVPLAATLAVIGVSILLNVAATIQGRAPYRLTERDSALYIAFDIIQLTVLLTLTGGILNPFSIMILAPLTVSATILSSRSTILLCLLCLVCITAMYVWHYPLPGPNGVPASDSDVSAVYKLGVWIALSLAALFIAVYVWKVADDARRIEAALKATELALSREQRISSLGALAAAAAHELGTPLGTIAIVARDIVDDLPPDSPLADDAALVSAEAKRCRDILARLAQHPDDSAGDNPFETMSLATLIEAAASAHVRPSIAFEVMSNPMDESDPVMVRRTPALMHGLGNLLENAMQFAETRVVAEASWSADEVRISICDDGPGFPQTLLNKLGEPYISDKSRPRTGRAGGMGLGIFIAKTLLEKSGARILFGSARESGKVNGGAMVTVIWHRHNLETEEGTPPWRNRNDRGS